ncbi:MAG: outer membrane lipoprotein carrier protein LolA [Saprospiraceae bacterium]
MNKWKSTKYMVILVVMTSSLVYAKPTMVVKGSNAIIYSSDDPKAKIILDAVKEAYKAYNNITINFSLHIEMAEKPKSIERGRIIQQIDQFKVEMKEQHIYCDGKDLWYHLIEKEEVQINDYEGSEDVGIISPSDLLRQYESGNFDYSLIKEYKSDQIETVEIEFKPRDSFSDYSKLRVVIDKNNTLIKEVLAFGKDGSRFKMIIDNETYDQKYNDDFFRFDKSKFPNVIVEDLRLD